MLNIELIDLRNKYLPSQCSSAKAKMKQEWRSGRRGEKGGIGMGGGGGESEGELCGEKRQGMGKW